MLKDVYINKSSLKQIQKDIHVHSPHPNKVEIIAVTKKLSYKSIQSVEENNIYNIGENKIQETQKKLSKYKTHQNTKIHLIGHLQTNKASKAVQLYNTIHSVDTIKILKKINTTAYKQNKKQKIFLQIKLNKTTTQSGFSEKEIISVAKSSTQMSNIIVVGLMVIAPNTTDPTKITNCFSKTQKIQQYIYKKINHTCINLSMGMSQDYILALKQGATHLRIGTKLFNQSNV